MGGWGGDTFFTGDILGWVGGGTVHHDSVAFLGANCVNLNTPPPNVETLRTPKSLVRAIAAILWTPFKKFKTPKPPIPLTDMPHGATEGLLRGSNTPTYGCNGTVILQNYISLSTS